MTDKEILDSYRPMVSFLAQLCGPYCEVLLHDISNPNNSVIEIANGFHSGRTIGFPMTDLATKVAESDAYAQEDFLSNYTGAGKGKNFLSSTYFIKNKGRLIGLLCVNRDMSPITELESALSRLKSQCNLSTEKLSTDVQESFDAPVTEMISNMVHSAIEETGILPERMSIHEKVTLVHKLKEQGILKMKGAVSEIAQQLQISEPTVYRYIKRDI